MIEQRLLPASDAVEVAEVARTLRLGWRSVVAFLALGILGAGAVVLFAPPAYTGKSSVLVRSSGGEGGAGSILAKLAGGALEGTDLGNTTIETELQVLKSRALAESIVDSLRLEFKVRAPLGVPASALIGDRALLVSFAPRKYSFDRIDAGRYRVGGSDVVHEIVPGKPTNLEVGSITLAAENLPPSFAVKIYDREDAVTRFQKRLTIKKAGGDIVSINYSADDRASARVVPNALIDAYLEQRKTIDRGTNQRRVEFLTKELAEVGDQLSATERSMRRQQEASGVVDPEIVGKVELEGNSLLRRSLIDLEVESGAINQLLAQLDAGEVKPRQLAAHPAFLRGSSMTPIFAQLSELEAQRVRLLERRTEKDPEMIALEQSIRLTEQSFVSTARSYASTLNKQRNDLRSQIDSVHRTIVALPAATESGGRLKRDILRLSQIYAGVQAQLVQAQLAAIGEGGHIRQLDFAISPRKPSFPEPFLTMGIGTVGGLVAGMIAALILGWFGRWLRDPLEIQRATGLVAQRLGAESPLFMAGASSARTLLVIPVDDRARAGLVAQRLVRTAENRAVSATFLDLSHTIAGNGNGAQPSSVGVAIDRLEQQYGMVVVQLPSLASEATAAALRENRPVLLVAPPGRVHRARLESAVQTLRHLQIPCAGVVISDEPVGRAVV